MGIREYARHWGVAHTTVLGAIRTGRIHRAPGGKIHRPTADQERLRNTDQSRPRNSISGEPHRRRRSDGMETPIGSNAAPSLPAEPEPQPEDYVQARARRERTQASAAELAYLRDAQQLLLRADASDVLFRVARATRDAIMALPPRLAPLLAAETSATDVQHILEEALRTTFNSLAQSQEETLHDPSTSPSATGIIGGGAEPFALTPPAGRRR